MKTATRDEVSVNDLAAVMEAAILLRSYGLISVVKIREIRQAVHEDAMTIMERHEDYDIQSVANSAWRATYPDAK